MSAIVKQIQEETLFSSVFIPKQENKWNICQYVSTGHTLLCLDSKTEIRTLGPVEMMFKCLNIIQKEMSLKVRLKSKATIFFVFCWALFYGILYRQRKIGHLPVRNSTYYFSEFPQTSQTMLWCWPHHTLPYLWLTNIWWLYLSGSASYGTTFQTITP